MTLAYFGGRRITGTAADRTGGSWINLAAGWIFVESDTGNMYYWTGSAWTAIGGSSSAGDMTTNTAQTVSGAKTFNNQTVILKSPTGGFLGTIQNPSISANSDIETAFNSFADYIVYKNGANYFCKSAKWNHIVYNGSLAEDAIAAAISNAGVYGTIFLQGNTTYNLSPAFTGFNVLFAQTFYMGLGCRINIPSGYAGSVFKLYNTTPAGSTRFYNGFLQELTSPQYLWTGFDIYHDGTTSSTFNHTIRGTKFYGAKNSIALRTNGTGWTNGNLFDGLFMTSCINGILFEHVGTWTAFQSGCHANMFSNIIIQYDAGVPSDYGIKDVNGQRNIFLNCYVADFVSPHVQMSISANASFTHIIGGTCTTGLFSDLTPAGSETFIRDQYQGDVAFRRRTAGYEDIKTISAPASPSTGFARRYARTVDTNNDALCVKRKINGAIVEVQL